MSQQGNSSGHPVYPPAEDEIDLADLVGVLYQQGWLIVGVIIAVLLLGVALSLIMPKKFEYRSLLEVGQYQRASDGKYQFVEPPKAVAGRIDAIAQTIYQKWEERAQPEDLNFSLNPLQVNSAETGGVLEVKLEASKNAEVKDFFREVSSKLIQDHDRIFDVEEQKIQENVQRLEATIKQLRQEKKSYQKRTTFLSQEEDFLKKQVQESSTRLDKLIATKADANIASSEEPVGLLLFSSEIQRVRRYIDKLRNRLLWIPTKREKLQVDLQKTSAQITTKQAELESQNSALQSINRTQVLLDPTISNNPTSPNLKLNLALSLVLGLFLAVFAAFVYEFWSNNRNRITESR